MSDQRDLHTASSGAPGPVQNKTNENLTQQNANSFQSSATTSIGGSMSQTGSTMPVNDQNPHVRSAQPASVSGNNIGVTSAGVVPARLRATDMSSGSTEEQPLLVDVSVSTDDLLPMGSLLGQDGPPPPVPVAQTPSALGAPATAKAVEATSAIPTAAPRTTAVTPCVASLNSSSAAAVTSIPSTVSIEAITRTTTATAAARDAPMASAATLPTSSTTATTGPAVKILFSSATAGNKSNASTAGHNAMTEQTATVGRTSSVRFVCPTNATTSTAATAASPVAASGSAPMISTGTGASVSAPTHLASAAATPSTAGDASRAEPVPAPSAIVPDTLPATRAATTTSSTVPSAPVAATAYAPESTPVTRPMATTIRLGATRSPFTLTTPATPATEPFYAFTAKPPILTTQAVYRDAATFMDAASASAGPNICQNVASTPTAANGATNVSQSKTIPQQMTTSTVVPSTQTVSATSVAAPLVSKTPSATFAWMGPQQPAPAAGTDSVEASLEKAAFRGVITPSTSDSKVITIQVEPPPDGAPDGACDNRQPGSSDGTGTMRRATKTLVGASDELGNDLVRPERRPSIGEVTVAVVPPFPLSERRGQRATPEGHEARAQQSPEALRMVPLIYSTTKSAAQFCQPSCSTGAVSLPGQPLEGGQALNSSRSPTPPLAMSSKQTGKPQSSDRQVRFARVTELSLNTNNHPLKLQVIKVSKGNATVQDASPKSLGRKTEPRMEYVIHHEIAVTSPVRIHRNCLHRNSILSPEGFVLIMVIANFIFLVAVIYSSLSDEIRAAVSTKS